MSQKLFIDCHCHLFNIEDVPLYPTVAGKLSGVSRGLLLLAAILKDPKKELKNYRVFVDYFDMLRRDSTLWLANQMSDSLRLLPGGIPNESIMTPLIMDFDMIQGSHEDVTCQASSLIREIKAVDSELKGIGAKVLPFVGIDLRKLTQASSVATVFDGFLHRCGGMKSPADRQDLGQLENGDIIGVKLYPPIGFNPFSMSSTTTIDPAYKRFYELCIARKIPITVHCQPASGSYYASDMDKDKVDGFVHARNWEKVFERNAELQTLRINFAHFGGDGEIAEDVLPDRDDDHTRKQGPRSKIPTGSWTRTLVRLLKKYDNTYADLGAFNYDAWRARLALAWLLVLDESGDLAGRVGLSATDDKYKLKDKLLWGSDVPMILGKPKGGLNPNGRIETYSAYVEKFVRYMDVSRFSVLGYEVPKKTTHTLPSRDELIDNLTSKNPLKFLLGVGLE